MSLSFLTPLLLVGAATLAIPIVIHLIMRQKPKHLLFPAFRFLQQKHRTTVQKLRLRHLLLLAMRMLLFLLLCLALARPELSGSLTGLANDAPVGLVLIFDTSPSMSYEHEGQARLDLAKEQALHLLEGLPSGSRVAVFDTAESGGQFVGLADAVKQVQNRRIQALNRPVTASLDEAFRVLAGQTPDLPLLLAVFSDRTAASWNTDAASAVLRPAKQRLTKSLPAFYFDLNVKQPRNVTVVSLAQKQGNTATPLDVLLYGGLATERFQLQAVVQVTGASVDSELLLVMDNQVVDAKRLKTVARPGEVVTETIVFKPLLRTADVHQGDVHLKSSDALEADNLRYWSLASVRRKVLILADREADALDWQIALEESPLGITCTVMSPKELPANLNPDQYQAVCLMNLARPSSDLWEILRRYLTLGGGLVVLPGEDSEPDAYNVDAAQAVLPARLLSKQDLPLPRGKLAPTDYEHPIMQPFKEWERQTPPGSITRFWKVQLAGENGREILPLDFTDAQGKLRREPVLIERLFERSQVPGRVVLYTTAMYRREEWKEAWNTFYQTWVSAALPLNTMRYVLGAREEKQNFQLGDDVRYWLPRASGLTSYQLAGPLTTTGEIKDRESQIVVQGARRPGNYKLTAGDSWSRHFSMNLNPAETNLQTGGPSPSEVEELLGADSLRPLEADQDIRTQVFDRLGHAPKVDLLPWLMIGVLVLLALENLLANRFYKREPEA